MPPEKSVIPAHHALQLETLNLHNSWGLPHAVIPNVGVGQNTHSLTCLLTHMSIPAIDFYALKHTKDKTCTHAH